MRFEKTDARAHSGLYTVHASASDRAWEAVPHDWFMAVHFDLLDKKVIYPVKIKPDIPGMEITLDSALQESCQPPPAIPGPMVDRVKRELENFRAIVDAARRFIENQLCELEKERKE